jgi:hypothetical protein
MITAQTPRLNLPDTELKDGGGILAGIITLFALGGIAYGIKIYYDYTTEFKDKDKDEV